MIEPYISLSTYCSTMEPTLVPYYHHFWLLKNVNRVYLISHYNDCKGVTLSWCCGRICLGKWCALVVLQEYSLKKGSTIVLLQILWNSETEAIFIDRPQSIMFSSFLSCWMLVNIIFVKGYFRIKWSRCMHFKWLEWLCMNKLC